MEFTIQKAKSKDAAELIELNMEFNKLKMPVAVVKRRLSGKSSETVFLARTGQKVVGYACIRYSRSICYPHPWAEITEMYVRCGYRRKGVAAGLLAEAEKEATQHGVNQIVVLTGEHNMRGQGLYSSTGYHRTKKYVYEKTLPKMKRNPRNQVILK